MGNLEGMKKEEAKKKYSELFKEGVMFLKLLRREKVMNVSIKG